MRSGRLAKKSFPDGVIPLREGPRRVSQPLAGGSHHGDEDEYRDSAGTSPEPHTVIIAFSPRNPERAALLGGFKPVFRHGRVFVTRFKRFRIAQVGKPWRD